MSESNRTGLIIAFVAVVVLFLVFGGGAMSGSYMGRGMMGDGMMSQEGIGGYGWMWIPTFLALGLGIILGWMIFRQTK